MKLSLYIGFYSVDSSPAVGMVHIFLIYYIVMALAHIHTIPANGWDLHIRQETSMHLGQDSDRWPFPQIPGDAAQDLVTTQFKCCTKVILLNDNPCCPGDWVVIDNPYALNGGQKIGMILEILQIDGSATSFQSKPDFVSVQMAEIMGVSPQ